jgi:hypothetical protein
MKEWGGRLSQSAAGALTVRACSRGQLERTVQGQCERTLWGSLVDKASRKEE